MNEHDPQPDPQIDPHLVGRMAGQPFRPLPAGWRAEVLTAARARAERPRGRREAPRSWWLDWFLRLPLATTGLVAVLMTVGLGTWSDRWLNGPASGVAPVITAEQFAEVQAQRTLLLQLAGLDDQRRGAASTPPPSARPPSVLRPRGDRRERDGFGPFRTPRGWMG